MIVRVFEHTRPDVSCLAREPGRYRLGEFCKVCGWRLTDHPDVSDPRSWRRPSVRGA